MVRLKQRAASITHGLVRTGRPQPSTTFGADAVRLRAQDAGKDSRPQRSSVVQPQGAEGETAKLCGTEDSSGDEGQRTPSELDRGGEILYLAFGSDGYAKSWRTATNKGSWRAAAGALLRAVDEGVL